MPKAWFCIPSARPIAEVLPVVAAWKAQGYGVALQRDGFKSEESAARAAIDTETFRQLGASVDWRIYAGYAEAVNYLAARVLKENPECDWVVCAGDDTFPDPDKTGDEIAAELHTSFFGSYGVMQPTGDRWADNLGVIIERIAGSPWLGREWCRRAHGGRGPLWPEFRHMFGDESLQLYAQSLGVFLQRPDLTHHHAHAQREPGSNVTSDARRHPAHMAQWNTQAHWQESKAIFERLKSTNFAECQPIP